MAAVLNGVTTTGDASQVTSLLIKAVTDLIPDAGAMTDISADTARLTAARAGSLTDWEDGERLDVILDAILADVAPEASHHELVWPRSDGKGTAGIPLEVTSNASDESNAAAATQNYFGEPTLFDIPETSIFNLLGTYVEADTQLKTFLMQFLFAEPALSSAKSGGNAWNEAATVLSVGDGSLFATSDLVAIVSDYKIEIQEVASVSSNDVTVAREASQFGANNTGLRWNHTTNDPGTEVMYRVWRSGVTHFSERYFSAASSKDSRDINFHDHRRVEALGLVLLRSQNQTDSLNGAHFEAAISYEQA